MYRSFLPLAVALMASTTLMPTLAAGVWKCKDGERTIFSDTPCPTQGSQMESRLLQPNLMQAEKVPPKTVANPPKASPTPSKRLRSADRLKRRQSPATAQK